MKRILFLGAVFFCGFFQPGTCNTGDTGGVGELADDHFIDPDAWLQLARCDDLPEGRNAIINNVEVTGAIVCDSPRGLLIPSGAQVIFRAKDDLVISGMQILVAPDARLSLMSEEGILLTRTEAMGDVPVLLVGGDLEVSAGRHVPGESKFTEMLVLRPQEDQEDLLVRKDFGTVYYSSGQEVLFDENLIVVADEVDRSSEIAPQEVDETEDLPNGAEDEPSEPTTDHLKHGQSLRGRSLVSSDGAAEVRLGMHGSVLFARYPATENLEVSEDGKTSSPMEVDTLIHADSSKVKRVLEIRSKLANEAAGGKHANKAVLAWTPWVRRYNRQVDMARQHSGEVDMAIDDKGCLEVTVDGYCVLSRSGSHRWEWMNWFSFRKKSPGYGLHIVEKGVEVQLDSKKVWGVTLPEKEK